MISAEEVVNTQASSISKYLIQNQNTINSYQVIIFIWLIAVVIIFLYYVYRHVRFLAMIKRWCEETINQQVVTLFLQIKNEMNISSKVTLDQCACITSPMMIGLIRPRLLLPLIEYPKEELCLIFKHELTHFKRKDLWYKILVIIARILHWFNPIVYWIAKEISVQCEISCDEAVIQNEGIQVRKLYGQTILNAAQRRDKGYAILSTNFNGGDRYMKSRINYVDDSLNEYLNYGISYNKTSHQWLYQGQVIHYLTDGDILTYVDNSDNSVENGVSLEVLRKDNGEIEGLVQIDVEQ